MNPIGQLLDLLRESTSTVAFTGAGVSTASGIRDFRGKDGIYRDTFKGYAVEELFGLPLFERDPSLFYEWSRDFVYALDAHRPNVIHRTLAELERRGLLDAVVTQNIDRLHTLAGSRTVHELHGSPHLHHCLACGRAYPYDDVAPTVRQGHVPRCACGGVLKPDIVFYGESLPEHTLQAALDACRRADLLLVLGSSLTVYPAAALPREAYECGARLVIVNDTPTPLDRLAILRLPDLVPTFTELAALL
ncbi:MAG TPA: NAD-dependent protein deacylase [Candidatus Spyradenecus faecavium]|uniref:protein acetyllysine N-acetyltransferase n=1 Tax=Candidatus Spyradenecus faecavium TaxID=2840947 RepID=A0A9D1NLH6_9BACT|nr:NAD-dependent protein deacylase [Candidatus Spyradenecus faecavium]